VFAVAFELPAASVPWRGGSSFSGDAPFDEFFFAKKIPVFGKTQMTLPASEVSKLQIQKGLASCSMAARRIISVSAAQSLNI